MSRGVCKACGAAIVWATTRRGQTLPVDAFTAVNGTIELRYSQTSVTAIVHDGSNGVLQGGGLHTSHLETCPFEKQRGAQ